MSDDDIWKKLPAVAKFAIVIPPLANTLSRPSHRSPDASTRESRVEMAPTPATSTAEKSSKSKPKRKEPNTSTQSPAKVTKIKSKATPSKSAKKPQVPQMKGESAIMQQSGRGPLNAPRSANSDSLPIPSVTVNQEHNSRPEPSISIPVAQSFVHSGTMNNASQQLHPAINPDFVAKHYISPTSNMSNIQNSYSPVVHSEPPNNTEMNNGGRSLQDLHPAFAPLSASNLHPAINPQFPAGGVVATTNMSSLLQSSAPGAPMYADQSAMQLIAATIPNTSRHSEQPQYSNDLKAVMSTPQFCSPQVSVQPQAPKSQDQIPNSIPPPPMTGAERSEHSFEMAKAAAVEIGKNVGGYAAADFLFTRQNSLAQDQHPEIMRAQPNTHVKLDVNQRADSMNLEAFRRAADQAQRPNLPLKVPRPAMTHPKNPIAAPNPSNENSNPQMGVPSANTVNKPGIATLQNPLPPNGDRYTTTAAPLPNSPRVGCFSLPEPNIVQGQQINTTPALSSNDQAHASKATPQLARQSLQKNPSPSQKSQVAQTGVGYPQPAPNSFPTKATWSENTKGLQTAMRVQAQQPHMIMVKEPKPQVKQSAIQFINNYAIMYSYFTGFVAHPDELTYQIAVDNLNAVLGSWDRQHSVAPAVTEFLNSQPPEPPNADGKYPVRFPLDLGAQFLDRSKDLAKAIGEGLYSCAMHHSSAHLLHSIVLFFEKQVEIDQERIDADPKNNAEDIRFYGVSGSTFYLQKDILFCQTIADTLRPFVKALEDWNNWRLRQTQQNQKPKSVIGRNQSVPNSRGHNRQPNPPISNTAQYGPSYHSPYTPQLYRPPSSHRANIGQEGSNYSQNNQRQSGMRPNHGQPSSQTVRPLAQQPGGIPGKALNPKPYPEANKVRNEQQNDIQAGLVQPPSHVMPHAPQHARSVSNGSNGSNGSSFQQSPRPSFPYPQTQSFSNIPAPRPNGGLDRNVLLHQAVNNRVAQVAESQRISPPHATPATIQQSLVGNNNQNSPSPLLGQSRQISGNGHPQPLSSNNGQIGGQPRSSPPGTPSSGQESPVHNKVKRSPTKQPNVNGSWQQPPAQVASQVGLAPQLSHPETPSSKKTLIGSNRKAFNLQPDPQRSQSSGLTSTAQQEKNAQLVESSVQTQSAIDRALGSSTGDVEHGGLLHAVGHTAAPGTPSRNQVAAGVGSTQAAQQGTKRKAEEMTVHGSGPMPAAPSVSSTQSIPPNVGHSGNARPTTTQFLNETSFYNQQGAHRIMVPTPSRMRATSIPSLPEDRSRTVSASSSNSSNSSHSPHGHGHGIPGSGPGTPSMLPRQISNLASSASPRMGGPQFPLQSSATMADEDGPLPARSKTPSLIERTMQLNRGRTASSLAQSVPSAASNAQPTLLPPEMDDAVRRAIAEGGVEQFLKRYGPAPSDRPGTASLPSISSGDASHTSIAPRANMTPGQPNFYAPLGTNPPTPTNSQLTSPAVGNSPLSNRPEYSNGVQRHSGDGQFRAPEAPMHTKQQGPSFQPPVPGIYQTLYAPMQAMQHQGTQYQSPVASPYHAYQALLHATQQQGPRTHSPAAGNYPATQARMHSMQSMAPQTQASGYGSPGPLLLHVVNMNKETNSLKRSASEAPSVDLQSSIHGTQAANPISAEPATKRPKTTTSPGNPQNGNSYANSGSNFRPSFVAPQAMPQPIGTNQRQWTPIPGVHLPPHVQSPAPMPVASTNQPAAATPLSVGFVTAPSSSPYPQPSQSIQMPSPASGNLSIAPNIAGPQKVQRRSPPLVAAQPAKPKPAPKKRKASASVPAAAPFNPASSAPSASSTTINAQQAAIDPGQHITNLGGLQAADRPGGVTPQRGRPRKNTLDSMKQRSGGSPSKVMKSKSGSTPRKTAKGAQKPSPLKDPIPLDAVSGSSTGNDQSISTPTLRSPQVSTQTGNSGGLPPNIDEGNYFSDPFAPSQQNGAGSQSRGWYEVPDFSLDEFDFLNPASFPGQSQYPDPSEDRNNW